MTPPVIKTNKRNKQPAVVEPEPTEAAPSETSSVKEGSEKQQVPVILVNPARKNKKQGAQATTPSQPQSQYRPATTAQPTVKKEKDKSPVPAAGSLSASAPPYQPAQQSKRKNSGQQSRDDEDSDASESVSR